ncbi:MAG: 3-deoxy-D-manno-octulosonic acid transferase, partial [Pseudohongiellaceae bacterium]
SMGEMQLYYGAADIAFVGGSLVNTGCQNILEPAVLGLPILTGPSLFNFQAISEQLISAGALRVVENPPALAKAVRELLHNQALYRAMSVAAEKAVRDSRGATDSVYEQIARLLPGA